MYINVHETNERKKRRNENLVYGVRCCESIERAAHRRPTHIYKISARNERIFTSNSFPIDCFIYTEKKEKRKTTEYQFFFPSSHVHSRVPHFMYHTKNAFKHKLFHFLLSHFQKTKR